MAFLIHADGYTPRQWGINENKPGIQTRDITLLAADGDELESIRTQFYNIPITKGNRCEWRDEMARFIYSNLL